MQGGIWSGAWPKPIRLNTAPRKKPVSAIISWVGVCPGVFFATYKAVYITSHTGLTSPCSIVWSHFVEFSI
jgi:hypothetical protein